MRFRNIKKRSKQQKQRKDQLASKVRYASYPDKIKAFIVDLFMIYVPILYVIAYVVLGGKDAFQASQWAQFFGILIYALIYAAFLAKTGQTPGKRAYEIKVVDAATYKKISFLKAMLRFFTFLVSATILLGLILPFFRKDKRALHDLLSSTVEIKA